MEMSPEYAQETVNFLATRGFNLVIHTDSVTDEETQVQVYYTTRYTLTDSHQEWVLEVVTYSDGMHRYFLQLQHYYLQSFSFELDSWKYRDEHIEFRYYTNPETGGALTFKLRYPDTSMTAPDA